MTRDEILSVRSNRRRITRLHVAALCDALIAALDACANEPDDRTAQSFRLGDCARRNIVKGAIEATALPALPPEDFATHKGPGG